MSFAGSKYVWKNGSLIPWGDATTHLSCHALHYGTGVFEGIRCYRAASGSAIFRLGDHINRLFRSADVYDMEIPYSPEELAQAVVDTVSANELDQCYIRPIAFFGSGTLKVHPRNMPVEAAILCWSTGEYFGAEGLEKGIRVTISRWMRFRTEAIPANAKACGQYVNSVLASQEAYAKGFDEAILLDHDGYLAEGAGENLFLIYKGELFTNDQRSSILMGITRDTVITLARDLGIRVRVMRLKPNDLYEADEAFFSGTAAELTPIASVDGRIIGTGGRGPKTTTLQNAFFKAAGGQETKYGEWLTYVGDNR